MAKESESSVAQFLRDEVPDWGDDMVARARYKAFTGQRADWENRLQFWRSLIVKCARHLDVISIDPNIVQHRWFLREGVTPLGISMVLTEMHKSGELQTREELLSGRPSLIQYTNSALKQVLLWMSSQVLGTSRPTEPISAFPSSFIVAPLLQERISRVLKSLSETEWTNVCIITMARFQELCGCRDTADILMGFLALQTKARSIKITGKDGIEGLKVSLKEGPVPDVTESDSHILQLHWTMERLQQQHNVLEQRIASSRASAVSALKTGDKQAALRHARRLKTLISSKEKCEDFMDRIDEVLTFINDAEATKEVKLKKFYTKLSLDLKFFSYQIGVELLIHKDSLAIRRQVADAVKVGAQAIKEKHVTLNEVHTCLKELDDAIFQQRETQEALAEAADANNADQTDFEEEFALLQTEIKGSTDSIIESPPDETTPKNFLEGEQALEREFAKLELELA